MKWKVQIKGDSHDLRELMKTLVNDDLRITEIDNLFYLETNRFIYLASEDAVISIASEMLPMLTGTVRLLLGGRVPLLIVNVLKVNSDGTEQVYLCDSDSLAVKLTESSEIKKPDGTAHIIPSTKNIIHATENVPIWINIALENKNVSKALRLIGSFEHDWGSLYRLFEVIVDDVGSTDVITGKGWATKKMIKRFKHTANSPSAIGDSARHGTESSSPPAEPMTLGEAISFVEIILHNWLRTKVMEVKTQ